MKIDTDTLRGIARQIESECVERPALTAGFLDAAADELEANTPFKDRESVEKYLVDNDWEQQEDSEDVWWYRPLNYSLIFEGDVCEIDAGDLELQGYPVEWLTPNFLNKFLETR